MRVQTVVLVVFLCSWLVAGGRQKSDGDSFEFKYGQSQPKEGNPRGQSMAFFEEELEKRSGGRIQVESYFSNVLGNESEMLDQLVTGTLQGTRGGSFRKANPDFAIFELPFLVSGWDEGLRLLKSEFTQKISDGARQNGIYVPAVSVALGFRSHTNNVRPIKTPDDLKGLKMRVPPSKIYLRTAVAFGAQAFEIPGAEIYQSLKLGVADGQDNAPANIYALKLQEVQKFISISNYSYGPDPLMVNLAWYESLPADLQKIFDEVAVEAMAYCDQLQRDGEAEYLDQLKQAGMQVNYIDAENLQKFRQMAEGVYQQFVDDGTFTWEQIRSAQAYARGEM